jgi:Domain of unknown function (DUF6457)
MSTLDDWTEALCAELGLDPAEATQKTVLNLARVVAHTVDRPAAPLTAYLLGLAVGGGAPLAETAAKVQQLARGWPADPDHAPPDRPARDRRDGDRRAPEDPA